jgi:aryl-alcohol dehydrogenase-like predicted oxidoreductase
MTANDYLRRLGNTDLLVSPIGLGAMQFSGGKGMFRFFLAELSTETMDETLRIALESGINWIDTAEIYGGGESERAVAHALKAADKAPGDIIVTTKWAPMLRRAKSISRSARNSTDRLDPYSIDLYLIHQPWSLSSIEAQMNAMADLVDSGIVRAVGVSNFSAEKMIRSHEILADRGIPLATNQVKFSLLHRRIEENGVLEAAKELGVTITAYTPLGMGVLTGRFYKNPELLKSMPRFRAMRIRRNLTKSKTLVDNLESIAVDHEATAAQVALNWAISFHGDAVVAIPGASKPHQAEQNAGAMRLDLSSEEMGTLAILSQELM